MSAAQSQSQTTLLPPWSYWSVKQAGRGRKLKSRREHEMGRRRREEEEGGEWERKWWREQERARERKRALTKASVNL